MEFPLAQMLLWELSLGSPERVEASQSSARGVQNTNLMVKRF